MSPPFHHNKLESIGEQLAAGGTVEAITASQQCSERTVFRVQRRMLVTGQATPLFPGLRRGPARLITPEIEEVWSLVYFYTENG